MYDQSPHVSTRILHIRTNLWISVNVWMFIRVRVHARLCMCECVRGCMPVCVFGRVCA